MVIYIEYLIIDNLVMDYLIFYLMAFTFKIEFKRMRLFAALMLGVLCAFFMPYLLPYKLILVVYKIIFSIIIVLTLMKVKSLKKYIFYLFAFWIYTFLIGGIILGLLNVLNISYDINGVILYNCEIPMGAILVLCVITIWLLKNVIIAIKNQIKNSNYMYKIKLIDDGHEVIAMGFLDSGNKVKINGNGVNIISINLFQKLHKDISVDRLLLGRIDKDKLKNMSYINISSLNKSERYLTFTIDKMIVENESFENVNIAVAIKNFEDFDCILSESFVGGVV